MIEANENIDLVTMRRQQEVRKAQEDYRQAVSEGRLVVRPRATERAQLEVATSATAPAAGTAEVATTSATVPVAGTAEVMPSEVVPAADPEAAWRHTRLAVTAGLVLLLLVVWIWQKRSGR